MTEKQANNQNTTVQEWSALSVVKFLCVAVMVFVHAHMMLITKSYAIADTSGFFYRVTSQFMFLGLFLFMLPIIAGAIFRMELGENIVDGTLYGYNIKKTLHAAIFLVIVGFGMNLLTAGIWYIFSWNVLQLMAVSLLVIVLLLRFFSLYTIFLLGTLTLFAAEPLRNVLGNLNHLYPIGILVGADNAFYFWPFFPWFSVVAFGFLFAHFYLKYKDNIKFRLGATGVGILFLSIAGIRGEISPYLDPKYVWGANLFQPKIGLVLATMGLFCVLTAGANYFFQGVKFKKYGIINSYSKGIIWIYVVQMVVNYRASTFIKHVYPMDKPSAAYFILPVGIVFVSWLVGALSIKLLQEKRIVLTLKKIDE